MENTSLDFLMYSDSSTDPLVVNGLTIPQMINMLSYIGCVFGHPDSTWDLELNAAHLLFLDEHAAIFERTGLYHRQTWTDIIYPYLQTCLFHYILKTRSI